MRFIDEAKIKVMGGHGGPGCVSFRRETFVPRGGPDGGDGGEGGSVIFVASNQLGSLQDFRFKRVYQAPRGMHGSGANKAGRDGEDITLAVPVGTLIKDFETQEVLFDFSEDGQTWTAVEGGRGGKGNAHFVSSTFQAPKFAQPGEEGKSRELILELKLLADVGIIGFPNAGKSTLISRISAAKPKIADYPFTTLTPHLGVVSAGEHQTFVVADIPGLVEGAHRGVGLGHKFLRHIERTRVFVHLLDASLLLSDEVDGLLEKYRAIRKELGLFHEKLLHKPEIVVLNKIDVLESEPELLDQAREALKREIRSTRGESVSGEPLLISGVSGNGLEKLIFLLNAKIHEEKKASGESQDSPTLLPDDERLRH